MLNPIAELEQPDSGKLISATAAKRDYANAGPFFCPSPDCNDPMRRLFIKESVNGNYFFSHYGNYQHEVKPETLLHKAAVRWFKGKTEFGVPKHALFNERLELNADKTDLEYRGFENHRPYVKLTTIEGREFCIEIKVTHAVDTQKRDIITKCGLPTLEIDLSEFYECNQERCRTDLDFIQMNLDHLLNRTDLKKWIYASNTNNPTIESDDWSGTLLISAISILLGWVLLKKFRRRKNSSIR